MRALAARVRAERHGARRGQLLAREVLEATRDRRFDRWPAPRSLVDRAGRRGRSSLIDSVEARALVR